MEQHCGWHEQRYGDKGLHSGTPAQQTELPGWGQKCVRDRGEQCWEQV